MRTITLDHPRIEGHAVFFRWHVDPPSGLYRSEECHLEFPPSVALGEVPERAWWWIAFMLLHPHWAVLRPCRISLPVAIGAAECEFWLRLMDTAVATMEVTRGTVAFDREIEIVDGSATLPPVTPQPLSSRCGTAFSGGKDSLLQTGLLADFTTRPLLVTVTAPLPPMQDHLNSRRREILREITERRDVELVEVKSDYRAAWDNAFPRAEGFKISTNEISDTFLYLGALVAVGLGRGTGHLFVASEIEVNENADIDGRFIQHPHFMYSTATLGALDRLVRATGIRISSLTPPLYSIQVQTLLWRRYPDLRGLQFSCWNVSASEQMCSSCPQCLRIGMVALSEGFSPSEIGIDILRALRANAGWMPRVKSRADIAVPADSTAVIHHSATAAAFRRTGLRGILKEVARHNPGAFVRRSSIDAWRAYRTLSAVACAYREEPPSGYRREALRMVDECIRDQVGAVFADAFIAEAPEDYVAGLARTEAHVEWVTAPLGDGDRHAARREVNAPISQTPR